MKFFPKETQPHRFRKETPGHQENQDAVDRKEKNLKRQKTPQDYNSLLFKLQGKTEKYGKRNVASIPLRP